MYEYMQYNILYILFDYVLIYTYSTELYCTVLYMIYSILYEYCTVHVQY